MKKLSFVLFCFAFFYASAQDISYNRKMVDTLTSSTFWGRGYTKDGMNKAAGFIAGQFKTLGLQPLDGVSFFQPFTYSANTFPGKMEVEINDKKLIPGVDYIIGPESTGSKSKGALKQTDSAHFVNSENRIIVSLEKKLTWSAEQKQAEYTSIQLDKSRFAEIPKSFKLNIDARFTEEFKASNVCAMIKGTAKPDSFLFITAHYDHLGGMGNETFFPGANDNASGVALLLSLAKYYSSHPQRYSIAFVLFAGEEIGLLGSKYYTENPIVPLRKIRFLTNTDLAGTGEEGITVVNATIFPKEFALMNRINDENKYLVSIGARGEAANSDHYWFTRKGVPAFFFYTKGGIAAYHDVFDKASTLPLTEQADLQELLIKFNTALQQ